MHVLDTLEARGFVQQVTHHDELHELLGNERVTYYVGFDPTADSLHVGNLLPIMMMAWLQRAGHRPIAVFGGGTGMVGDPSGKTEMRQLLDEHVMQRNLDAQRKQVARFLALDGVAGVMVNNADWLMPLNYIAFLRDVGSAFSVNRMLAAEAYKLRLEKGLSFIEFNYQLLQAYDFLVLYRDFGCTLQLGGDDQWGNIIAGTDLIRRKEGGQAFGLTCPLLTTATGAKMGKTAGGAVWLDADKLSPFDFYQYWVSCDDRDVGRFLKLYTFVDLADIAALEALEGADIREAKHRLAWEVTAIVHGAAEADTARKAARDMVAGAATDNLPTHLVSAAELADGVALVAVLAAAGLTKSNGEGRRLIQGGGVKLDNERVDDANLVLTSLPAEGVVVRVGKKRSARLILA